MSKTILMVDGDIYFDSAGRSQTVEGAQKCSQDLAEIFMTILDAARDYGSELIDFQLPEPVGVFAGKALVSQKVSEAVQRLMRYQHLDLASTPDERIKEIDRLVVRKINSTDYTFWVRVTLESGESADRLIAVSLRHQESARFSQTIEALVLQTTGAG